MSYFVGFTRLLCGFMAHLSTLKKKKRLALMPTFICEVSECAYIIKVITDSFII